MRVCFLLFFCSTRQTPTALNSYSDAKQPSQARAKLSRQRTKKKKKTLTQPSSAEAGEGLLHVVFNLRQRYS